MARPSAKVEGPTVAKAATRAGPGRRPTVEAHVARVPTPVAVGGRPCVGLVLPAAEAAVMEPVVGHGGLVVRARRRPLRACLPAAVRLCPLAPLALLVLCIVRCLDGRTLRGPPPVLFFVVIPRVCYSFPSHKQQPSRLDLSKEMQLRKHSRPLW